MSVLSGVLVSRIVHCLRTCACMTACVLSRISTFLPYASSSSRRDLRTRKCVKSVLSATRTTAAVVSCPMYISLTHYNLFNFFISANLPTSLYKHQWFERKPEVLHSCIYSRNSNRVQNCYRDSELIFRLII